MSLDMRPGLLTASSLVPLETAPGRVSRPQMWSTCRRPSASRVCVAFVVSAVLAGCLSTGTNLKSSASNDAKPVATPTFCSLQHPAAECVVADNGRFAVAIVKPLDSAARAVGVSLVGDVKASLIRVARLLPGPRTDILIYGSADVIAGTGVNGSTDSSGLVQIMIDTHQSRSALKTTLRVWLLQALSHEIDHSVRFEAGPGFGLPLLDQLITEGLASAFDVEVQPTLRLPWAHALSARQERELWNRARPLLQQTDLYNKWFYGAGRVPHWTGFQIGYHIVSDYISTHPGTTAASLVDKPATVILSGSHYTP